MSDRIIPDQSARDAIVNELDRNLLVEAAAGTGKTTSMVGRMVALLRTGKCRAENIAAVTFTRKAASELRERFQLRLEKDSAVATGREKERLKNALADLEKCFIGTIHSFCGRILRERPVEAGVPLSFTEMEDEEDRRLRLETWDKFSARILSGETETVKELERLDLQLNDLRDPFANFCEYSDVEEWPVTVRIFSAKEIQAIALKVRDYLAHMQQLSPSLPNDCGTDTLIPLYKKLPRTAAHFRDLGNPKMLARLLCMFEKKAKITQKHWLDAVASKDEAKEELARFEEFVATTVTPFMTARRAEVYALSIKLMSRAESEYSSWRREAGMLNFQDLLTSASRMLRGNPHVRKYFAERYTRLLVDEFQDTDPVQAELMLFLTGTNREETDWKKCTPRPGSLFVVGDPKQSIYRFRRADIETYNEVKKIIGESGSGPNLGQVLELSANFRTGGAITEWVNDHFQNRFPELADEFSPTYVPLWNGRKESAPGNLHGMRRMVVPEELSKKSEDIIEWETETIASTIRHWLDTGATVTRSARETAEGKSPACNPSDFLIVTYNTKKLADFAAKLTAYNIPHQVTGGTALNRSEALLDLCTCIAAALKPYDALELLALARGRLWGISDATLYRFKKAGGIFDYNTKVPEQLDRSEKETFEKLFGALQQYSVWLESMPPVSALRLICEDSGIVALCAGVDTANDSLGALTKILELLRVQNPLGAHEALDYLQDLLDSSEKHDSFRAVHDPTPVVRVMNLHKVKGLEAPVVFLAGAVGGSNIPPREHVDRSGTESRGFMSLTKGQNHNIKIGEPEGWEEKADRENRFLQAEKMRLLYVAATRAGAMMTVTIKNKYVNKNPWQNFAESLGEIPELEVPERIPPLVSATSEKNAEPADCENMTPLEINTCHFAALKTPSYRTLAAKTVGLSLSEKMSLPADNENLVQNALPFTADAPEDELPAIPGGAAWGSVLHSLLELIQSTEVQNLESSAKQQLAEYDLDASLAPQAAEAARAVARSEVFARSRRAEKSFSEAPFVFKDDGAVKENAAPTLIRGSIDLVFEEEKGWVIVDYKTDRITPEFAPAAAKRYAGQLSIYRNAWEKLSGESVSETGIFFTAINEYIKLEG